MSFHVSLKKGIAAHRSQDDHFSPPTEHLKSLGVSALRTLHPEGPNTSGSTSLRKPLDSTANFVNMKTKPTKLKTDVPNVSNSNKAVIVNKRDDGSVVRPPHLSPAQLAIHRETEKLAKLCGTLSGEKDRISKEKSPGGNFLSPQNKMADSSVGKVRERRSGSVQVQDMTVTRRQRSESDTSESLEIIQRTVQNLYGGAFTPATDKAIAGTTSQPMSHSTGRSDSRTPLAATASMSSRSAESKFAMLPTRKSTDTVQPGDTGGALRRNLFNATGDTAETAATFHRQRTPDHMTFKSASGELGNPSAAALACNCLRSSKLILCRTCGGTMFGRVRQRCPVHPSQIFLMDFECCGKCMSRNLKEVCSYSKS